MKHIDIFYKKGKHGKVPDKTDEQGFCYNLYAARGVLVPPLTFKPVKVSTDLKISFSKDKYAMKINLRREVVENTPLILSSGTDIIEGDHEGVLELMVRNSFIDSRLVDFVFDIKGNRISTRDIPKYVLNRALRFYNEETEILKYGDIKKEVKDKVYKTHVPAGTVYIARNDHIGQVHFQEKVEANFIPSKDLQ